MRKIKLEVGFNTKILLWLVIIGLFFNGVSNLLRPSNSSAQLGSTRVYVTGGSLDGIDGTVTVDGSVDVNGTVDVSGTVNTCEMCQ
ncbi:MAG TPA: hypothetical protein VNL73_04550 [Verrucomicrobiae bacterium]|nr:hypothetical protein [Verrucomicrobiae bacterium]